MTYSPKYIKEILKTFVEECIPDSTVVKVRMGEPNLISRSIFEIESYFLQILCEKNINKRLDSTIASESILKNFRGIHSSHAFRPVDYQYNLLFHLCSEFKTRTDLFWYIDLFIEKYKSEFHLADIVITNSGATRCKTNIRFALNGLRNLGLVLDKDANRKRSWAPSILGIVALLNIQLNKPECERWFWYKDPNSLIPVSEKERSLPSNFSNDPVFS